MKCPNCGYENSGNVCIICGTSLNAEYTKTRNASNFISGSNSNYSNNYDYEPPQSRNDYNNHDNNSNNNFNNHNDNNDNTKNDNSGVMLTCGCCCIAIVIFLFAGFVFSDNSDTTLSLESDSDNMNSHDAYYSQDEVDYSEDSDSSDSNYDLLDDRPSNVPSSAQKVVIGDIIHREDTFMDYDYDLIEEGAANEIIGLYEADYAAIVNATDSIYPVGQVVYLELSRDDADSTSNVTYYAVNHVYSADGRKII